MHPHLHRKMRRFLTEPDDNRDDNDVRFKKLTLKEFKLDIGSGQNLNEISIPKFNEKSIAQSKNRCALPQAMKRPKQRHALFKLPEILNQNDQNQEQISEQTHKNPIFKRSNPLYVVNTLFQMMKQDISEKNVTLSHSKSNDYSKKNSSKLSDFATISKNEFSEFEVKNTRMQRAPRLLDNQINRLTQQSIFSRRRIYSEEKTRAKYQKDTELITFYNCKERSASNSKADPNHRDDFKLSQK